jgi:5-methylcytosine-specific restriction enzyme A
MKYCLKCWNKAQDHGLSRERTKFTLSKAWSVVRHNCFERDNYTCQHCGDKNRKGRGGQVVLNAHHIKQYHKAPALRLELSNLLTLCQPCHAKVHSQDRGEDRVNSKLTFDKVKKIKELLVIGMTQKDIANKFEVSSSAISHISTGKTWIDV